MPDRTPHPDAIAKAPGEEGPRPYHHGDLRAALLVEAESLLAERGTAGFSLRAVAKRAGVSHAAPAHHFGDARGLLTALAARGFERLSAAQEARRAVAGEDPRERLVASGLGYVDFALAHPVLFGLAFDASRLDWEDAELREAAHTAFERLERDTARTRPDGAPDEDASLEDLRAAWGLVHGLSALMVNGHLRGLSGLDSCDRDGVIALLLGRVGF